MRATWRCVGMAVAAVVACVLVVLQPASASAAEFTAGPSVRLTPDGNIEITWRTDVAWYGTVYVFTVPEGVVPVDELTGAPRLHDVVPVYIRDSEDTSGSRIAATSHSVLLCNHCGILAADTTYSLVVGNHDPTKLNPDFYSPVLPLFAGTQALTDVRAAPSTTSADISWQGNVIGTGLVEYGTTTGYGRTVEDSVNTTGHAFTLNDLLPDTVYYFNVCNRHAVDGDCLASSQGTFRTQPTYAVQFRSPLEQSTDPAEAVINSTKDGKAITVRTRLSQGATPITDTNTPGPVTIAVSGFTCGDAPAADPDISYADVGRSSAGTDQFQYERSRQDWAYRLDTRALGLVRGRCYRIDVSVNGSRATNASAVFQPIG